MTIAVLAVQGAFAEHEIMLRKLGADYIELRKKEDLDASFDGIILPGGESTVQGKLLRELDMYDTLKQHIRNGMPVLGTCAGAILLADKIENDTTCHFGTMPMCIRRNAYGRQLGSFFTTSSMKNIGDIPMTFIRAPYIKEVYDGTQVMASVNGNIVGAKYQNQLALSFHPELDNDTRVHEYFLKMCS